MGFFKSEGKNILIFGALVLGVIAIYYFYFRTPGGDEVLTSQGSSAASSVGADEILAILLDLKTIKLEGKVFEDSIFQNLKDFHVDIAPEPKGRDNPFAPVSGNFENPPTTIRVRTFETQ